MLRQFFPSTDEGAATYGGFLMHKNCFCKTFLMKENVDDSLKEINEFLVKNGYEECTFSEFDETVRYEKTPVKITPHSYQEEFVLYIERDTTADTQIDFLINEVKKFRDARDWEQFHNAKDLSLAISIEASELLEQFLWKKANEAKTEKVKEELADVLIYSLLLADKLQLDVESIIMEKLKNNAVKYPVDKAKGTAKKYNEL